MTAGIRAIAALCLLLAGAAATLAAPPPTFYARREYGNNKGCAGPTPIRVADINSDGIPDIVCAGGQFLFGKGDGTFYLSPEYSELSGRDIAVLDLNGDGKPDIIGTNSFSGWGFQVSFGNGDGTFGPPTFYPIADVNSSFLAVGDFNGDGIPDVATAAELGVWVIFGKGGGVFNPPVLFSNVAGTPGSYSIKAADMNKDGNLDLVVGTQEGFSILFGNGDGTFKPGVGYNLAQKGPFLTVADINSDGYLDVLCMSPQAVNGFTILLGQPGGKLGAPSFFSMPAYFDVEVGDVNGDGIPDLVSDSVYIAYGLGGGKFSAPVYFPNAGAAVGGATSVVLAHLRSKNVVDLVTNDAFSRITVLLNKGNGAFIEGITTLAPQNLSCPTQGDFNGDGISDLGFVKGNSFLVLLGTGNIEAPFKVGPSTVVPEQPLDCPSNVADINGDGIPDVMVSIVTGSGLTFVPLFGVGDGSFVAGPPTNGQAPSGPVFLADVNGDGKVDYISMGANTVGYGNGDGTFQPQVVFLSNLPNGFTMTGLTWADLNGDGKLDFVATSGGIRYTAILLSHGTGTPTLTVFEDPIYGDAYYAALGDLNGDGFPDLVLGSTIGTLALLLNDGKGNFPVSQQLELPGLTEAVGPFIADFNGDGKLDVGATDYGDYAILTNEDGAVFRPPVYIGIPPTYAGSFIGNWHGQSATAGKPDFAIPDFAGHIEMLLNTTK